MQNKSKTEEYLRAVTLPEQTKTYTVISHGKIIDEITERLEQHGFVIEEALYKGESKGEIALGFMQLKNDDDPDMGMTFNWSNSYNKQLRFSCGIGGFIYDNKVPFVSSNEHAAWTRKHTGTALDDTLDIIESMIESAKEHFDAIIAMKRKFQSINVSRKDYAKIMGLLYFDKKVLNVEQASLVKQEYDKPSFDYKEKDTLWALYKIIMHAVKEQPPKQWYQQQIKINNYIQLMHKIVTVEDESEFVAEEEAPVQLSIPMDDLPDTIATTEVLTVTEVVEKFGGNLSEEQIEMIEREYAYPYEDVGQIKDFPVNGEVKKEGVMQEEGLVTVPETAVEEKSEILQEIDDTVNSIPAKGSLFNSILSKENPKERLEEHIEKDDVPKIEEEATCSNCGSEDVIFNASAQMLCDNCGHEEDTNLVEDDDEDEMNDMFLNEDTTDEILEEESEETVIHIESDEEYNARVAKIEGEPEAIETSPEEDLLELDNEEEEVVEDINPKIPGFIDRFYNGNINQKLNIDYKDELTIVTLESNEMFVI